MNNPPSDTARADEGLRLLAASTPADIRRELERVGCRPEGVRIMAPKGLFRLLRLEGVPAPAANILKQEMLAHGGDAAVHWQTVACGVERTAVVLLGTAAQFRGACRRLQQQPFGLAGTAGAILDLLQREEEGGERLLRCGPFTFPLGARTLVMGIVNVTPDSFSGDGLPADPDAAARHAETLLREGADILDIGGESTRPGATDVPLEDELARVIPVVRALASLGVPLSVDTCKGEVARQALDAGASIVNDVTGLRACPEIAGYAAETGAAVVVMHMQGSPRTMQQHPHYDDLLSEICACLCQSTAVAVAAGIPREQVILDPGFGFGKTVEQNLEILARLRELTSYGQPVLLGTSRKSTIGKVLGDLPPDDRVEGTAATVALGIAHGADIVRVHDVKAMARVATMTDAIVYRHECE